MVSCVGEEVNAQSEEEVDLDQRALKVQELFKFKSFYDQIDFNFKQRLAITKAIMELTNPMENIILVEGRTKKNSRFEDNVLV